MNRISPKLFLGAALTLMLAPGVLMAQTTADQQAPDATQNAQQQAAPAPPDRHAANPKHQARHLAKMLGLSQDQRARIEPIFASRDEQVQSILANSSLSPQQQHAQVRAARKDADSQVAAILTDQQNQQWQQIREQHHTAKNAAPANG